MKGEKLKKTRRGDGWWELYVPGREGSLHLASWNYRPDERPEWFELGKTWHLLTDPATIMPETYRITSFRYVQEAETYVAELVAWAEACEAAEKP